MKYLSILLILLISPIISSSEPLFIVEEGTSLSWKVHYYHEIGSEATIQTSDGEFTAVVFSVTNDTVYANITGRDVPEGTFMPVSGFLGLLVHSNDLALVSYSKIDDDFTNIEFDNVPLFWPTSIDYWQRVQDLINSFIFREFKLTLDVTDEHYIIYQEFDDTPVDGDKGNVSYIIEIETGYLIHYESHRTNYFTLDPPFYRRLIVNSLPFIESQVELPFPSIVLGIIILALIPPKKEIYQW
ncbi:MAG: hypothetical protein INQ03_14345 [Candidatus Heimdallarchaeota archaeon]|nr:hypothetical protein [Candidatus Heimdallarchaeota archaeon]